jgi:Domain of unknown function (DUF3844)
LSSKDESYADITRQYQFGVSRLSSELESRDLSLMIIMMPPSGPTAKRSAGAYGSYNMPRSDPYEAEEVALNESAENFSDTPTTSKLPTHNHLSPNQFAALAPAHTFLPVCSTSKEGCASATNNCTGRGTCLLKYQIVSDSDGHKKDCWACSCSATYRTNKDGSKKGTEWAGTACERKDVSVPFLLFAFFGVAMVSMITWSIGLLYSIGTEPLPGVIAAGVSNNKAPR